jgi:hypothetical protein
MRATGFSVLLLSCVFTLFNKVVHSFIHSFNCFATGLPPILDYLQTLTYFNVGSVYQFFRFRSVFFLKLSNERYGKHGKNSSNYVYKLQTSLSTWIFTHDLVKINQL